MATLDAAVLRAARRARDPQLDEMLQMLAWPPIVAAVCLFVIIPQLMYTLPRLIDMERTLGVKPPAVTMLLYALASDTSRSWPEFCIALLVVATPLWLFRTSLATWLAFRMPLIGGMLGFQMELRILETIRDGYASGIDALALFDLLADSCPGFPRLMLHTTRESFAKARGDLYEHLAAIGLISNPTLWALEDGAKHGSFAAALDRRIMSLEADVERAVARLRVFIVAFCLVLLIAAVTLWLWMNIQVTQVTALAGSYRY